MQKTKVLCHVFQRKTLKCFSSDKQGKDQYVCRHLCSESIVLESTRKKAFSRCDEICFKLTRTHDLGGEICPFEKYCKGGCPCPFYQCEKVVDEQTLVPVWDLKNGKINKGKLRYIMYETQKCLLTQLLSTF